MNRLWAHYQRPDYFYLPAGHIRRQINVASYKFQFHNYQAIKDLSRGDIYGNGHGVHPSLFLRNGVPPVADSQSLEA